MQRSQRTTTDNTATTAMERKDDGHSGVRLAFQRATLTNVGRKFSTYATISTTVTLALKTSLSLANASKSAPPVVVDHLGVDIFGGCYRGNQHTA